MIVVNYYIFSHCEITRGVGQKNAFVFIEGVDIFCALIRLTLEAVLKKIDLHVRLGAIHILQDIFEFIATASYVCH